MVAMDDPLLAKSYVDLRKEFPQIQFVKVSLTLPLGRGARRHWATRPPTVRQVGVDLSKDFMGEVEKNTKGLDISLLFNNAGFISTGRPYPSLPSAGLWLPIRCPPSMHPLPLPARQGSSIAHRSGKPKPTWHATLAASCL
jgi:hypothetical protein